MIGETSMISYVQLQQVIGKVRSQYKSAKSVNSGQIATHPAAQHSIELDQWQQWTRQRRRFVTKKSTFSLVVNVLLGQWVNRRKEKGGKTNTFKVTVRGVSNVLVLYTGGTIGMIRSVYIYIYPWHHL